MPTLTIAARAWDHLMPLATGSVGDDRLDLRLELRDHTPGGLVAGDGSAGLDGAETSLSQYVTACAAGDDRLVGMPVFVMRGFRHRCVLVRAGSDRRRLGDLAGARIGLTGWPDSGNTWTWALIRDAGVDLAGVDWTVGPLLAERSNVGRYEDLPAHVAVMAEGDSLVDVLEADRLDAILTPFMPPGFHLPGSPLRHLVEDYPAAERAELARRGYVPGIHLIAMRRAAVERQPWVLPVLLGLFERSKRDWQAAREKYADTTPWLMADVDATVKAFGGIDWMPYGTVANTAMTARFCTEMVDQELLAKPVDPAGLFAAFDDAMAAT